MAGEVACCGLIQTRSTKISRKFEPTLAVEAQTQTAYSRCRAPAPTTPSSAPVPTLLLPATEPCHHQVDITTAAVCVCRHAMYTAPRSQHPLALCRCAETRTHKQLHPCSWRDFRSHGYRAGVAGGPWRREEFTFCSRPTNHQQEMTRTTRNLACNAAHRIARTAARPFEAQGAMSAGGSVRSAVDWNIACNSLVLVNLCRGTNGCGRRAWWK